MTRFTWCSPPARHFPDDRLFDRLAVDLHARLAARSTRLVVAGWAAAEPVLDGIVVGGDALALCARRDDPEGCRAALGAVVRLAGPSHPPPSARLAAETVFAAVIPALRRTAGELTRRWGADPAVVDQDLAAAAWERIDTVAGRPLTWPDRTIVAGARDTVRSRLRGDARRAGRSLLVAEIAGPRGVPPADAGGWSEGLVDAGDFLCRAVRHGRVSPADGRLIWDSRVLGVPVAELAGGGRREAKTLVMRRGRAERALRHAC